MTAGAGLLEAEVERPSKLGVLCFCNMGMIMDAFSDFCTDASG